MFGKNGKNMADKIKEDDYGFLRYVDAGSGSGFWERIEDPEMIEARVPNCCPCCSQLLDNWCIPFYHRCGVCADCAILYLENKVDGEWKSRFPEGHFKTRNDKVNYVKQKIAEKRARQ